MCWSGWQHLLGVIFIIGLLRIDAVSALCIFSNIPNSPLELHEELPQGTSVYNVTVTGDPGTDVSLTLGGSDKELFSLDEKEIKWKQQYDLDKNCTRKQLLITVICTKLPSGPAETMELKIDIYGLNDNDPYFVNAPYEINVDELTSVGSMIYNELNGHDNDCSKTLYILYKIQEGPGSTYFDIPVYSKPEIFLTKTLDYEEIDEFNLTVVVYDGIPAEKDTRSNTTFLTIKVLDADDLSPIFDSAVYVAEMWENETSVDVAINAFDQDIKINDIVYYSFADPERLNDSIFVNEYFSIQSDTGEITVRQKLNREAFPDGKITVGLRAAQNNSRGYPFYSYRDAYASLVVTLLDVNDNTPNMSAPEYYGEVQEHSAVGTIICGVMATDLDEGSNAVIKFVVESDYNMFAVDIPISVSPSTSISYIRVNDSTMIDAESTVSINFTVYAVETLTRERYQSSKSKVSVTVIDINDNSPQFEHGSYYAEVHENITQETYLTTVTAYDVDMGKNGAITYIIMSVTDNGGDIFTINKTSGELFATDNLESLDAEKIKNYNVIVLGTDNGDIPNSNSTTVKITVLNVNDDTPVFIGLPYITTVSEGALLGATVIKVMAIDGDGDELFYSLISSSMFSIDNMTGEIFVSQYLDREKTDKYNLSIQVTDGYHSPVDAFIILDVTDINDNDPLITANDTKVMIPEMVTGEFITVVNAIDFDDGLNGKVTYKISDAQIDLFNISDSGVVTTAVPLDREEQATYNVYVLANDQGRSPRTGITMVTVELTDVNDNQPVFEQSIYNVTVAEKVIGYHVITVKATDDDEGDNAIVRYGIVAQNDTDHDIFEIDAITGKVTISESVKIEDYGGEPLIVVIEAYNIVEYHQHTMSNHTTKLRVTLEETNDTNLYDPMFTSMNYELSVHENEDGGIIWQLNATDPDSDGYILTYGIMYGNEDQQFNISQEGVLAINGPLDRETESIHILLVYAEDNGLPPRTGYCAVKIEVKDVNDHLPVFQSSVYQTTVLEGTSTEVVTKVMATDKDIGSNAIISYTFNDTGGVYDHFSIENTTGIINLIEPLYINRNEATFELIVVASNIVPFEGPLSDVNTAIVKVSVMEVNIDDPSFNTTTYQLRVKENGVVGKIGQVFATDGDIDGDIVSYGFYYGNEDNRFNISQDGSIFITDILDREERGSYTIVIYTEDNGLPPRMGYTIVEIEVEDENDNLPAFEKSHYNVTVAEGTSGNVVLKVTAHDDDVERNAEIRYYLTGEGNPFDRFAINENTGEISIVQPLYANETGVFISLEVVANNTEPYIGTSSSKANATVLVVVEGACNKFDPQFNDTRYTFKVYENDDLGKSVGHVYATDPDTNFPIEKYEIMYGADEKFNITEDGEIHIIGAINREHNDSYTLIIKAIDNGLPEIRQSVTEVVISVEDLNDNKPKFSKESYFAQIEEHSMPGTLVDISGLDIMITDDDIGINAEVTVTLTGDGWDNFVITMGKNGVARIQVANDSDLDREVVENFTLRIHASNFDNLTVTAQLVISLIDLNDNPPVFVPLNESFKVVENETVGFPIGSVMAYDIDADDINKDIHYFFINGDYGQFSIDRFSGNITVADTLYGNVTGRYTYNITVLAYNPGTDRILESSTWISIEVGDYYNVAPIFPESEYSGSLYEDETVGDSVLVVSASDINSGQNGNLNYTISSDGLIPFEVNKEGVISVTKTLDRERTDRYIFDVIATDAGQPPLNAVVPVTITILDVNDNPPVFDRPSYNATVLDKSPIGLCALSVRATDDDIGANGIIEYDLAGNGSDYFKIDKNTGFIQIAKKINSHEMLQKGMIEPVDDINGTYFMTMNVVAIDTGMPQQTTDVLIKVTVVETVIEKPLFNVTSYEGEVKENMSIGSPVLTVSAELLTESGDSIDIKYFILGGSDDFDITDDGTIMTKRTLNREDRAIYNLAVGAVGTISPFPEEYTSVTILIIDVNEYEPRFCAPSYEFQLSESVAIGENVGQVVATDRDFGSNAEIRYTIIDGLQEDAFKVNETTGFLSVGMKLDRERNATYNLTIMAGDLSDDDPRLNSSVEVIVHVLDVNDNSPQFTRSFNQAQVSEIDPPKTSILQVFAVDADDGLNGLIYYRIVDIIYPTSFFYIEDVSGIIRNTHMLSGMGGTTYTLTIEAYNENDLTKSNVTQVVISITEAPDDDKRLLFQQAYYRQTIAKNHTSDQDVVTVNATYGGLKSSDTVYSIVSETYEESIMHKPKSSLSFKVEESSGKISVNGELESVGKYTLSIEAYNKTNSNKQETGHYDITEVVVIVVGYNNSRPVFSKSEYTGSVNDADSQGTLILTVMATDLDVPAYGKGDVTYHFVQNYIWVADYLDLGTETGTLTKGQGNLADYGDDYIIFEVLVTDGGVMPLSDVANVTVRVNYIVTNRYTPEVMSGVIEISEDIPNSSVVHQVNATDTDDGDAGTIRLYSIENIGGNSRQIEKKFVINETSGVITTNGTFDYDEEQEQYFQLLVSVIDNGNPSKTGFGTLDIYVQDVNDNRPKFKMVHDPFYVTEDQGNVSVLVGQVEADDIDFGNNARINYTMIDDYGLFMINMTTGEIFADQPLDRESRQEYSLTVTATNSYAEKNKGFSDVITVFIVVKDINDNAPYFLNEPYYKALLLGVAPEYLVFTAETNDIDSGYNSEVSYRLEADSSSVDALKYFKISETSGELRVASMFPSVHDIEGPEKVFTFTIVAYDNGSPRRNKKSKAIIVVKDSSYDEPTFLGLQQEIWINMTEHNDSCQILPKANYTLTGNQQVIYNFAYVCGHEDTFRLQRIDEMTFKLCNNSELDREVIDSYTLKVIATVGNSSMVDVGLMSSCDSNYLLANELLIHVTILDINDNAPYFLQPVYVSGIHDYIRYGESILQVKGYDEDIGINEELCYYVDEVDDRFDIGCLTGDVYARSILRGLAGEQFTLDVKAHDVLGTGLEGSNSTQAIIHILTVYDYCIMESKRSNANISKNLETIKRELEALTNLWINVFLVAPRNEEGIINPDQTDMWFYVVNPETYQVLPFKKFLKLSEGQSITRKRRQSNTFEEFSLYWNVVEFSGIGGKIVKEQNRMTSTEIAVLVTGMVIMCGSLLGIFYLLCSDRLSERKLFEQKEYWDRITRMSSIENPYLSLNDDKVNDDAMVDNWISPLDPQSEQTTFTRKIIYEEQELSMNLFQDTSDLGDDWSYADRFEALQSVEPFAIDNPAFDPFAVDAGSISVSVTNGNPTYDGDSGENDVSRNLKKVESIPMKPVESQKASLPPSSFDVVVLELGRNKAGKVEYQPKAGDGIISSHSHHGGQEMVHTSPVASVDHSVKAKILTENSPKLRSKEGKESFGGQIDDHINPNLATADDVEVDEDDAREKKVVTFDETPTMYEHEAKTAYTWF